MSHMTSVTSLVILLSHLMGSRLARATVAKSDLSVVRTSFGSHMASVKAVEEPCYETQKATFAMS